ncbi:unnamed protein product [Peronospora destructor]|nr:unnamed protein product [Peronospora destructor]
MDHMRVFGSQCYAHVTKEKREKLDDSGVKCYFLDYAKNHKAYRLLNASDGSIVVSRSVTFAEHSIAKTVKINNEQVIDIIGDEEEEVEAPNPNEVLQTPPMQACKEPTQRNKISIR